MDVLFCCTSYSLQVTQAQCEHPGSLPINIFNHLQYSKMTMAWNSKQAIMQSTIL